MLRFLRFAPVILVACAMSAQDGGKASSAPPTLSVTTRLVFVDVLVKDAHGNPVRGLTQQNFQLTEDGKPQTVEYFLAHVPENAPEAAPAPASPATEFSNADAVQEVQPLTIVLYDLLDIPNDDQLVARQQFLKFLDALPKGNQIALFTFANGIQMVEGTAGSSELRAAATKMVRPTDRGLDDSKGETMNDMQIAQNAAAQFASTGNAAGSSGLIASGTAMQRSIAESTSENYDVRAHSTIEALDKLAQTMANYPGRKSLYWLAENFPLSIDTAGGPTNTESGGISAQQFNTDLTTTQGHFSQTSAQEMRTTLNRFASARIAVYPVSIFGLATEQSVASVTSATVFSPNPGDPRGGFFTLGNLKSEMDDLARETGGELIFGNNDIAGAMRRSLDDSATYYTLAYRPTNESWDGRFRSVHVDAVGAGSLIYRRGYFATENSGPAVVAADFVNSMRPDGELATALKLHSKVLHAAPGPSGLMVQSTIDTADVTFLTSPDGHKHAKIFVQLVAYNDADRNLKSVPQTSGTLNIDLDPQRYDYILKAGIGFQQQLALTPGSYHVLLGVKDETGQKLGTVDMPLAISAQ
jgi:VWFA-related protein